MKVSAIVLVLLWLHGGFSAKAQTSTPFHLSTSTLQLEYNSLRKAKDAHSRALHSYLLSDAADEYADSLNRQIEPHKNDDDLHWRPVQSAVASAIKKANKYGASLLWCEYSGEWTSNAQGYLAYLSEWPDGTLAEEAWWRGKLHYRVDSCVDAAGSEEETAEFVQDYTEFLAHFPHGKHEQEARALLKEFQEELDAYKQEKNK